MTRKRGAVPEREVSTAREHDAVALTTALRKKGWTASAPEQARDAWYVVTDAPARVIYAKAAQMGASIFIWGKQ